MKNCFIESTGTDYVKLCKSMTTMVQNFSKYCKKPFTVEPVLIEYADGTKKVTPELPNRTVSCSLKYASTMIGFDVSQDMARSYMKKMGCEVSFDEKDADLMIT